MIVPAGGAAVIGRTITTGGVEGLMIAAEVAIIAARSAIAGIVEAGTIAIRAATAVVVIAAVAVTIALPVAAISAILGLLSCRGCGLWLGRRRGLLSAPAAVAATAGPFSVRAGLLALRRLVGEAGGAAMAALLPLLLLLLILAKAALAMNLTGVVGLGRCGRGQKCEGGSRNQQWAHGKSSLKKARR